MSRSARDGRVAQGGGGTEDGAAGERPAAVCPFGICPICAALTALGHARPEMVEHLLLASREVLLAARTLIDARLEDRGSDGPRLERVVIG